MTRIDWGLPLETDEPTPLAARLASPLRVGSPHEGEKLLVLITGPSSFEIQAYYDSEGNPPHWGAPRLRNVRPVRTADEALQRMEALVRRLATSGFTTISDTLQTEAREIVALLPEPPVDPDLIEARRLAVETFASPPEAAGETLRGDRDDNSIIRLALAALKRGRELALDAQHAAGLVTDANA